MDYIDVSTAHALLWENGTMINLQDQIPADSGWVLRQALGINDQGQIAGFGVHEGKIRAFLLTPTIAPQPNVTDSTDPDASAVDAMAAKKPPPPPENVLWPAGAQVVVGQQPLLGSFGSEIILTINWPIINGVDHYRKTVVELGSGHGAVVANVSPAAPGALWRPSVFPSHTYEITVTAYDGPDETAAHSESITTKYRVL